MSAPATARRKADDPRRVAFDVLRAVAEDDAYANLLLPVRLRRASLSGADAAFATELTYGTLRRSGLYDRIIASGAGRDTARIDPAVLDLLRLGTHQLLGMGTPPHAAVDTTVALARRVGSTRATGFINAVLRRVSEADEDTWIERASRGVTDATELRALRHAHPAWVVRALGEALQREERGGELDDALAANNAPPRVSLVALPGRADPPAEQATGLSPTAYRADRGDPAADPLVRRGDARVQDEGSQLAALVLSRARPVIAGEQWLDLCAGPGGKAALLAAEAAGAGAHLVANEVVPARAELVRAALAPIDAGVEVRVSDGRDIGRTDPERFDRILLDAPCTGLGALRRRPEARWRKTEQDIQELSAIQGELLTAALAALAPGGMLAYVTCSPVVAETTEVVDAVLARTPGMVAVDTPSVLSRVVLRPADLGETGTAVQLWPHRHGTDAMFIQLLQRAE